MSEEIDLVEAGQRVALAANAYREWATFDLWAEFALVTDEAWEGREAPDPEKWAVREALGLALIARGFTTADLERGFPQQ